LRKGGGGGGRRKRIGGSQRWIFYYLTVDFHSLRGWRGGRICIFREKLNRRGARKKVLGSQGGVAFWDARAV
jgi:hypothetical protein